MLDVGRLRLLLAISEQGGVSGAARVLGRPAAALAAEVTDASRSLGLELLDGDTLTPAGRRLAEHGGRLLGQLEAAESDAAAIAGRLAGTLRLGVGADAGRVLLADALPALRSAAPDLSVHVRQLPDSAEQVGSLGSTLDVVVVGEYGSAVPHRADAAVERRELFTEPLLLAVPTRHRATGASVRLAELAAEAWIGGAGDALTALERASAGAGFAPRVVAEVGEDALALTLVAAGQGVALVPASAAPAPVDGVRFLTVLDGGLRRTVVAAVRRSAIADPGVTRLLEALAAAARRVAAAVPGVSAAVVAAPSGSAPAPSRRPDPLLDPLPETPSAPPRNGRRDPWADKTNGSNGSSRNGFGSSHFPSELPPGASRNGFSAPADPLSAGPDSPAAPPAAERPSNGGATRYEPPARGRRRAEEREDGPGAVPAPGEPSGRRGPADGPRGPVDLPRGPVDLPRGPVDLPLGLADGPRGPGDLPRGPVDLPRGPGDLPPSGHDLSGRAATSNFGPSDLSGPGSLPAPGGELPSRGSDLPSRGSDLPSRGADFGPPGAARGPADFGSLPPAGEPPRPNGPDFGSRPPAGDPPRDRASRGPADFGSLPPAGGPSRSGGPDFGSRPPAGEPRDRASRGPADFGSLPPSGEPSRSGGADFGSLPPAGGPSPFGGADFGALPPAGEPPRSGGADFGALPPADDSLRSGGALPAGEPARPGRPADFGSVPAAEEGQRGGRRSADSGALPAAEPPRPGEPAGRGGATAYGALPPAGELPSRGPAPAGEREFGTVPPAGLPAPGAELRARGGASPYRTPPSTGDLPPGEMPRLGNELGPNPYRPDPSAHPAPDPFRAGGPDQGPNPYRSNGGRRGDSLGGVELFSATRNGTPEPPAPRSGSPRRAPARGGDGADGTLPPAPAGTPAAPASIFDDLRSEWFVQRDGRDEAPRNPSWQMAADDGWAAAARLAEPTTAGTTTAGLPRRRPQAMAVPGAVGGQADVPPPSTTHRSPQEVRGRLSSYRDGVRRGRHAERPDGEDQ